MLDIQAKVSTFRKMVWDREKEKSEKELYDSSWANSKVIEDKRSNLSKLLKQTIENRKTFATTRKNEQVAKKEQELKNNFNMHREYLLNDLTENIKEKLIKYTKTDKYKDNLNKNIENVLKKLSLNKEDVIIKVKDSDKPYIDMPNVKTLEDKNIGGFILSNKDGDYQYNFTYLDKLSEKEYQIGKQLYQLLESESFNESKN